MQAKVSSLSSLPGPHKPRQARAIETQQRLLAATRDALMEYGYAGTTTQLVVKTVGMSQGALFRHFPTKSALLTATMVFVSEAALERFVQQLSAWESGEDLATAGLNAAWEAIEHPTTSAILEILLASRTDAALREQIEPAAGAFYEKIYTTLERFSLPMTQAPAATSLFWLMLDVMMGRYLANLAGSDPAFDRAQKELLLRLVRAEWVRIVGQPEAG